MNANDSNRGSHRSLLSNQQQPQQQREVKKNRGNRRNQRFRRQCRAKGMKPAKIEKLLRNRHQLDSNHQLTTTVTRQNMTTDYKQTEVLNRASAVPKSDSPYQIPIIATAVGTNQHKRKREVSLRDPRASSSTIPKSTSTISIFQSALKKRKKKRTTNNIRLKKMKNNIMRHNYRRPMYLKRSSLTLFKMLSKTLNCTFTGKDQQQYAYVRLHVLDQQYCLKLEEKLWQSYLTIGLQQRLWPDQLGRMAKTDDFQLCHQYLLTYLQTLRQQWNQCEQKLIEQSRSCTITALSVEHIDHHLKGYVDCQRKYLAMRNQQRIVKFKQHIQEKLSLKDDLSKHTASDRETIRRLMNTRQQQAEIWKEFLTLQLRTSCKFLPPCFDHLEQFIRPVHYLPLNDHRKSVQVRNKCDKYIQEAKRAWLSIYFQAYIIKIQAHDRQFRCEFVEAQSRIMKTPSNTDGASPRINILKDYMIDQTTKLKENVYSQLSSLRKKVLRDRQHSSSRTKQMIGVSPEAHLDLISNPFDKRQWNYLAYGPSMIRSNQSATRSRTQQDAEINKLHEAIFSKVQHYLLAHRMPKTHPNLKKYADCLLDYLKRSYCTPLSYKDQIEAQEQARLVASIRKIIQTNKLVIRMTDKGNNFYVGSATDFEEKVQQYFAHTNAFVELSSNPVKAILNLVWNVLHKLARDKLISQKQLKKMLPDRDKAELSHLYFNPKTHKDGIPVRPIENTIHAVTKKISDFLDQLIRPVFEKECRDTTVTNGSSLIEALTKYAERGRLITSTLFCTFDIHNLFTMLPQEGALDALVEFLETHGYRHVAGVSTGTIRQLAAIVLEENVFVYGSKIYRQILGGAMGSSFTLTLANIFMWKWQQRFVDEQTKAKEFFGRYVDDAFITWNKSEGELTEFLAYANTWHPNIKLDYKIDRSLPFLDVLVRNDNGHLKTAVYHKTAAEPYVVPFISDHPRHVFENIVQTALVRAVRYSSTFQSFQAEQRYVQMMLIYNEYPLSFIDKQCRKFYAAHLSWSSFLPLIDDETQYFQLRNEVALSPTIRQTHHMISNNDGNTEPDRTSPTHKTPKQSTTTAIATGQVKNFEDKLIFHYTHEKRFHSFKRDMHKLYEDHFGSPSSMNMKIVVGNRNRRSAMDELIRKRPRKALLQDKTVRERKRQKRKPLAPTKDLVPRHQHQSDQH